mmetsp:Transcript_34498/g.55371  ORF Transcript_34498/g.55371 Transcript_34498/m.55371 type:complete len:207 (+) Transcript_34498:829-1449(+)
MKRLLQTIQRAIGGQQQVLEHLLNRRLHFELRRRRRSSSCFLSPLPLLLFVALALLLLITVCLLLLLRALFLFLFLFLVGCLGIAIRIAIAIVIATAVHFGVLLLLVAVVAATAFEFGVVVLFLDLFALAFVEQVDRLKLREAVIEQDNLLRRRRVAEDQLAARRGVILDLGQCFFDRVGQFGILSLLEHEAADQLLAVPGARSVH